MSFSGLYCFCHLYVQHTPVILHSYCLCFWNEFWNHHLYFLVCRHIIWILTTVSQGLVHIMIRHTMSRQSVNFVDLITILRENVSKGLDKKRRKLAWFVFHLTEIRNVLVNAIDVDLKITWLQNVPSHQKIMRNYVSKYVLMKKIIVHATTVV